MSATNRQCDRWLRCTKVLACAMAGLLARAALAQPAAATPSSGTTTFRKIFVPDGDEASWPVGPQRYLAVEPEEFERLYRAAQSPADGQKSPPIAQLNSATYSARLEADALVGGKGSWTFTSAITPTLLEIGQCALAVADVRWAHAEATGKEPPSTQPAANTSAANLPAEATPTTAFLGTRASGQLAVLLQGSGRLDFAWSMRGQRDTSGGHRFELTLPRALASTLELDLPLDVTPSSDHGVVTAQAAAGEGLRRWRIELGPADRATLRIAPLDVLAERERLALVRQTSSYDISATGIELEAEFDIDVHYQPLKRVEFVVDSGLQLAGARYGETPLAWNVAGGGEGNRVVIELPEPVLGEGRKLRLSARGELVRGARWKLPSLRPEGLFWQEGRATIRVGAPLAITQISTVRCRQTGTAPLPAPLSGESIEVQFFDPQAAVEIAVERRADNLAIASALRVSLSSSLISAQIGAELSAIDGEWPAITAAVGQVWSITSVDSVPADALAEWSVEKPNDGPAQLHIRFGTAIASGKSLRLRIRAESLRPPVGSTLSVRDLSPLEFVNVGRTNEVICVVAQEGLGLRISEDVHLTRLDPKALETRLVELFETPPQGLLFANDDAAQALQLVPYEQPPRYAAETRLRVLASPTGVREEYRFQCQPDTDRVAKIYVRCIREQPEPLVWNWGSPQGETVGAQRLTAEQCAALGWTTAGETWEVSLAQPQANPFAIFATRSRPWEEKLAVNLATLPEAAVERASIELSVAADTDVEILNGRLRTQPADPGSDQESALLRGVFRYDPATDADPGAHAPLELIAAKNSRPTHRAIVWTSELHSRYAEIGLASHTAMLRVQNEGASQLELQLPQAIELREVWVDDRRVTMSAEKYKLSVPLPDRPRFVTVRMLFDEPGVNLRQRSDLQAPAIRPDRSGAAIDHQWTVELPADFEISSVSSPAVLAGSHSLGVGDRLLGTLWDSGNSAWAVRPAALWSNGDHEADEEARAHSARFLAGLGEEFPQLRQSGAATPLKLGAVLLLAANATAGDIPIFVDRAALARANVTPDGIITLDRAPHGPERGLALLARHGLALVCQPRGMVITSENWWSAHADEINVWRPIGWGWMDQPSAAPPEEGSLLKLRQWVGDAQLPWLSASTVQRSGGPGGAKTFAIRASTTDAIQAHVRYRPRWDFLAVCFGLGALAISWWRISQDRLLVAWLLLLTALALLAPESWVPLTSAAWLGAAAGIVLRGLRRYRTAKNQTKDSLLPRGSLATGVASFGLMLTAALCGANHQLRAAEAPVLLGKEDYRVFVPADSTGKPTGHAYQVPEELLFRLERTARQAARAPQGYLITQANYSGSLVRESKGAGCRLDALRVTYQLDVLTIPARVELPIARNRADLLPGTARLDGRPLAATWAADERSLQLTVEEVGEHSLELVLNPRFETADDMRRLDLAVPPVIDATAEFDLPEDSPALEVRGAIGPTQLLDQGRRLRASLGGANHLSVQWPDAGAEGVSATEIEEFVWLSVRPGSVTVELRLKYKLSAARRVRVATDPRLRLLSGGAARSLESSSQAFPSEAHILEFDAVPNAANEAVVAATFLVTGTSGVGKLRMPRFDPVAGRVTRRWLAFTIDPVLEFIETGTETLSSVAVADFVAAWGKASTTPNAAYFVPSNDVPWSLGTQPRETVTSARTQQLVTVGASRAAIRFEAQLNTTSGYVFQHTVATPPGFQAERVSVMADNSERSARWIRRGRDGLTIFLSGPTAGEHRLEIDGWVPIGNKGQLPLPIVNLENVAAQARELLLYRRSEIQVELTEAVGLEAIDNPADEAPVANEATRLIGHYRESDQTSPAGNLQIAANRPKIDSLEVTTLSRSAEGWQATYRCGLESAGGSLDEIVLEIPAEWQGPFRCVPQLPLRVLEAPSGGQRRLLLWPQSEPGKRIEFTLHGTLRPSAEQGLKSPRIDVLGANARRRFLILPHEYGAHQLQWETRGLEQSSLPSEAGIEVPSNGVAYAMLDDRSEAVLEGIDNESPRQRVRLADYSIEQCGIGAPHGLALFDLEPAGELACPLSIPKSCDLLQVFADGAVANLVSIGQNMWNIRLGPKAAPLRIQVLFRYRSDDPHHSGTNPRFAGPTLGNLPVERTIWRLGAEPAYPLEIAGGTPLSPLQHALLRVRSVASLIDVLGTLGEEGAPDEALRSFRPWARRWRTAANDVERVLATTSSTQATAVRAELAAIDDETTRLARRLGATDVLQQVKTEAMRSDQPGQLWEDLAIDEHSNTMRLFEGAHSEVHCHTVDSWLWRLVARWGIGAACLISAAIAVRSRSTRAGQWIEKQLPWLPPAILGVAGLCLGLHTIVGLVLLVLAIGAAGLALTRGRGEPRSASTEFVTTAGVVEPPPRHGDAD